jgi:hypothetical protein
MATHALEVFRERGSKRRRSTNDSSAQLLSRSHSFQISLTKNQVFELEEEGEAFQEC